MRFQRGGVQPRLSRDGAFLTFIDAQGAGSSGPAVRIHLPSGEQRSVGFIGIDAASISASPSGRYYKLSSELIDFDYGTQLNVGGVEAAFDPADTSIAFTSANANPISNILAGPFVDPARRRRRRAERPVGSADGAQPYECGRRRWRRRETPTPTA